MNEKKIRILYWVILVLGSMALGFGTALGHTDAATSRMLLLVWVILLVIGALCVYLVPYVKLGKKVDALTQLLTDGEPDRYIQELNALLEGTGSQQMQQIRLINLSVACHDKRDFRAAEQYLRQVNPGRLTIANRTVYWANLALICFYTGKAREACEIIDKQKNYFQRRVGQESLEITLSLLGIFYEIHSGSRQNARALYAKARRKWNNTRYAADFTYLEKELQKKR